MTSSTPTALSRQSFKTQLVDHAFGWLTSSLDGLDPTQPSSIHHPVSPFSPLLEVLHLRRLIQTSHLNSFASARQFTVGARRLAKNFYPHLPSLIEQTNGLGAYYLSWLQLETTATIFGDPPMHTGNARLVAPPSDPYTDLEFAYILGCFAPPFKAPDRVQVFSTWLEAQDYAQVVTSDQCYELCHAVFYLTDFGLAQRAVPSRQALVRLVTLMLSATLREGQLDLTAELVLTLTTLGGGDLSLLEDAWLRLGEEQLPSGAVPGPLFKEHTSSVGAQSVCDDDRRTQTIATCYHTTIVTILAAISGAPTPVATSL